MQLEPCVQVLYQCKRAVSGARGRSGKKKKQQQCHILVKNINGLYSKNFICVCVYICVCSHMFVSTEL